MTLQDILQRQYDHAKAQGWLIHFANAAAKYGHTTADLMGIASRESNMQNIVGDHGHGFSLMQLDIGSFPDWIKAGCWHDVEKAIFKGAEVLAAKRESILKASKLKRATVKFRNGRVVQFIPRPLSNADLRRCTVAAYNCGGASYYHFSEGNDPDNGTTGKNYGRDVIKRAAVFQDMLEADHVAPVPSPFDQVPSPVQPAEPSEAFSLEDAAQHVSTDTVKSIAGKAAVKAGGPIAGVWGWGIHGKVLVIVAAIIIAAVLAHVTYKHWPRIKAFIISKVKG